MTHQSRLEDEETSRIIGAALEVHRELGCGFVEQVYQDALAVELAERTIDFEREVIINIRFKNKVLRSFYRPDFICFGKIIVEVKATEKFTDVDWAQMINYLKAAKAERGLLLNFGNRSLAIKRLLFSEHLHTAIPVPTETV